MWYEFGNACHRVVRFLGGLETELGSWFRVQPRPRPSIPEPLLTHVKFGTLEFLLEHPWNVLDSVGTTLVSISHMANMW